MLQLGEGEKENGRGGKGRGDVLLYTRVELLASRWELKQPASNKIGLTSHCGQPQQQGSTTEPYTQHAFTSTSYEAMW